VLITGPSGAGKSDLALRLIDRGAVLVADDCTLVRNVGSGLVADVPATIAGRIEVRGIGILDFPFQREVPVALVVALDRAVERMPDPDATCEIAGTPVPSIALAAFEASAPVKVRLALDRTKEEGGA